MREPWWSIVPPALESSDKDETASQTRQEISPGSAVVTGSSGDSEQMVRRFTPKPESAQDRRVQSYRRRRGCHNSREIHGALPPGLK